MKERLIRQASVTQLNDSMAQRYSDKFWNIPDIEEEPSLLLYNRDRKQFEIVDSRQWLINWLQGLSNPQTLKEVLVDSRNITEKYGRSAGLWYMWECSSQRVADRGKHVVTSSAEFIYYKVPYGYNFPFIEKFIE